MPSLIKKAIKLVGAKVRALSHFFAEKWVIGIFLQFSFFLSVIAKISKIYFLFFLVFAKLYFPLQREKGAESVNSK